MKIAIITYSTYNHITTLANAIKAGIEKSDSAATQVDIFRVEETLSDNILQLIHAPPKDPSIPIATLETLETYDAFLFGTPTRFGNSSAQFNNFFDSTGSLWAKGALHGKPAGFFVSCGSLGGGQELTIRNMLSFLVHHGMVYIPLGYAKAFPQLSNMDELHGGSPYGAGTFAGNDGSRLPSGLELEIAEIQGESFAQLAAKLVKKPSASTSSDDDTAAASSEEDPKHTQQNSPADSAQKSRADQSTPAKVDTDEKSGCARCIIM